MISKILSKAVKLWLGTQVETAEDLELEIASDNNQILKGYVPYVYLASNYAVYQGLHLHQVQLKGSNIRINLSQVIKGKPLKLLEPVAIKGNLTIKEENLKASLSSPLLLSGLTDLLCQILIVNGIDDPRQKLSYYSLHWQKISLKEEKIIIAGTIQDNHSQQINQIKIYTGLTLANSHTLEFFPLRIEGLSALFTFKVDCLLIDLGTEVVIEQLNLESGIIVFVGGLKVMPE
ncbi:MAG: DUF2993 domain-containing protein [Xenococcaceae cyanobacterium MO_188.B29]|nr:DUF2993 domain-containing protein [Xenococcaceae cyanobacterium MO_188.B29]